MQSSESSTQNSGGTATTQRCGVWELLIFAIAIVTGTACSLCSKTMMQLHGEGMTGERELFEKPIFQTFGMFVGMMFGLVMHGIVLFCKIPFPGYDHSPSAFVFVPDSSSSPIDNEKSELPTAITPAKSQSTPMWMYWFLAIPSIFDLAATVLCMMGLRSLDVSIYQLLRGSGIIFVALMKQYVLGDRLYSYQWLGVAWNVISVLLVGATAVLNDHYYHDDEDSETGSSSNHAGRALVGVVFVMLGAIVQALQFVFEEKVMTLDEASVPPLLLIGMEGLWGTVLCLFVVYPLAYYLPGDDHGSYENPWNTLEMFRNTPTIQYAFGIYFFVIFGYNLFAVLVTFTLNSIWHAILDNFRPITIWMTDLSIYYVFTEGRFGGQWTHYSYLQLLGMGVLLYGTAIYNAPHAGSLKLQGDWWGLWLDFSNEYDAVEQELEKTDDDSEANSSVVVLDTITKPEDYDDDEEQTKYPEAYAAVDREVIDDPVPVAPQTRQAVTIQTGIQLMRRLFGGEQVFTRVEQPPCRVEKDTEDASGTENESESEDGAEAGTAGQHEKANV